MPVRVGEGHGRARSTRSLFRGTRGFASWSIFVAHRAHLLSGCPSGPRLDKCTPYTYLSAFEVYGVHSGGASMGRKEKVV